MREFAKDLREQMRLLDMDPRFAERNLNEGFGRARRSATRFSRWPCSAPSWPSSTRPTRPDVDAPRVVAEGVNRLRGPQLGVLLITHYTRIPCYIS